MSYPSIIHSFVQWWIRSDNQSINQSSKQSSQSHNASSIIALFYFLLPTETLSKSLHANELDIRFISLFLISVTHMQSSPIWAANPGWAARTIPNRKHSSNCFKLIFFKRSKRMPARLFAIRATAVELVFRCLLVFCSFFWLYVCLVVCLFDAPFFAQRPARNLRRWGLDGSSNLAFAG